MSGPNVQDAASGVPQQIFDGEVPQFGLVVSALSGTAAVQNSSTAVVFSAAQSLNAGSILYFSSQPGIPYVVAATTSASTLATLTTPYMGPNAAAATVNATSALAGTVAVTNASRALTFSSAQTMTAGTLLTFSSQPGVFYTLSAAMSGATAGTLSSAYVGPTAAAATVLSVAALAQTVSLTASSTAITFSAAVTLPEGAMLVFSAQPGVAYSLAAAISGATAGTLTTPWTGATGAGVFVTQGAADWLPSRGGVYPQANGGVARALQCVVAGTAIVDCYGTTAGNQPGNTYLPLAMTAGQQVQIALTKIHLQRTTGAFVALY